jgi:methionyl-tRNA synthetase
MALFYAPFMPETSDEVLARLSLGGVATIESVKEACAWGGLPAGNAVTKGDALFPRLDISDITLEEM